MARFRKVFFRVTYCFLLVWFIWPILPPFLWEMHSDVAKRIVSPDKKHMGLLIRRSGLDLNFVVKIQSHGINDTIYVSPDFEPDGFGDWSEFMTWSQDSTVLAYSVKVPGLPEVYWWAFDFENGVEHHEKNEISKLLTTRKTNKALHLHSD